MKKLYLLITSFLLVSLAGNSTTHIIDIPIDGSNTYSPDNLTILLGDTVEFLGSPYHPTTEVSEDTWNSNETTPLAGGLFESVPAPYQFVPTSEGVIYYVCDLHVQMGMKGLINVGSANSLNEVEIAPKMTVELGQVPVKNGLLEYSITSTDHNASSFSIYNTNGQVVLRESIESNAGQLELNVPLGFYIVLIKDRNDLIVYRESILVE